MLKLFTAFQWTPARLASLSFLSLILVGCLLLLLPQATEGQAAASWLDALFTAVSAVCVTGLSVQDTPTYFSSFGQTVILCLIQLGGLGIMTLSAALPILFGKQMKVSQREFFQGMVDHTDYQNLKATLTGLIKYTLLIEGVGALILTMRWYALWGDFPKALYYGIFHAISAFCNAGFSLFTDSLIGFRNDPVIMTTVMALIVLGGLGFVVITQFFLRQGFKSYTLHARFVLLVSLILVVVPTLFLFFSEFSNSFLNLPIGEKISVSLFQVVTSRTAGFNSIDLTTLGGSTIFVICILMFIGGAPGGTAGGVKVTTMGILFLSIRSIIRGRENIEIMGRRITPEQVTKAIGIMAISFMIVTILIITLMMTESAEFSMIFFEAISAFGTVGLSLGLTPELSATGKIIVALGMFIGRIGPLTLVFLIGTQKEKIYYRYPEGKLLVG